MKYNYADYTDLMQIGKQYFIDNFFSYTDNEVFVDAGCYHASTCIDFAKTENLKFEKIYAFEPDSISFKKSLNNFRHYKYFENKYELYKLYLSDKNTTLKFKKSGDIRSKISINGNNEIEILECIFPNYSKLGMK